MSDEELTDEVAATRKESQAQRTKRVRACFQEVLGSASGRVVLAEILGICQVESQNGLEGMAAGRVEGARSVGLRLMSALRDADLDGYLRLYGEIHRA
jgi:hypothetical protein